MKSAGITFVSHCIWTGALFRKKLPRVLCILLADDVHVFRVPTLQPSGLAGVDKGGKLCWFATGVFFEGRAGGKSGV